MHASEDSRVTEGAALDEPRWDDRRLVRSMLAGDERAFDAFFGRYFPPLYRFALARLDGDGDLAEEVVQRTMCNGIDRVATWRGEARLLTWLCAICRREIANHFRKADRAPSLVELSEEMPEVRAALESLRGEDSNPEVLAVRSQIKGLVHVALDRLPSHYALALEWKYLEGLSMKEIATRFGSTSKAVESLLTRARGAYREALSALLQGCAVEGLRGGV